MTGFNFKPVVAAMFMGAAFIGVWLLAHVQGLLIYRDVWTVFHFLLTTTSLFIGQVFLESVYGMTFRFRDHGFQLTLIALISLLTLRATDSFSRYQNELVGTAAAVVLALLAFVLYINHEYSRIGAPLPPPLRFLSYSVGVCAMEVYIVVVLWKEVKAWRSLF